MRRPSQPELFRPPLTYPRIPYGEMLTRPVTFYADRPAVISHDASLTFRELEGLVNAFANGLRGLGIGPGDCVCLLMTNRPEYVVAFLALARLSVPRPAVAGTSSAPDAVGRPPGAASGLRALR